MWRSFIQAVALMRVQILAVTVLLMMSASGCSILDSRERGAHLVQEANALQAEDLILRAKQELYFPAEDNEFKIDATLTNRSAHTVLVEMCWPAHPYFELEKEVENNVWKLAYDLFCPDLEVAPAEVSPGGAFDGVLPVPARDDIPTGIQYRPIPGLYRLKYRVRIEGQTETQVIISDPFLLQVNGG